MIKSLFAFLSLSACIHLAEAHSEPMTTRFTAISSQTEFLCRFNENDQIELYKRLKNRSATWEVADFNQSLNDLRISMRYWRKKFASHFLEFGSRARQTLSAKRRWKKTRSLLQILKECGSALNADREVLPCSAISNGSSASQAVHSSKMNDSSLRIINGTTCNAALTPVVRIEMLTHYSKSSCSGTLLNDKTVLTAAHCVDFQPSQILVYAGALTASVHSYSIHPSYNSFSFVNIESYDIAVLKLDSPLSAPIASLVDGPLATGEISVVAGYGIDEQKKSGLLKAVSLEITYVDGDTIATRYTRRANQNGNTCFGDSGGPLFVNRLGSWYVAGVVSNGNLSNCGVGDVSRYSNLTNPSALAFIQYFLQ